MNLEEKAREIIEKVIYITIATASAAGEPWNTPVYASYDSNFIFYWASWNGTQHSQNIAENPNVFMVIYDSTVPEGSGEGVYIQARARELTDDEEISHAIKHHYERKHKQPKDAQDFQGDSPRRMYRAVPVRCWVNLDSEMRGSHIDTRQEIKL